jgi:lysozyme
MIDVSEYQGKIDWHKVYGAGVRHAYIKFGENFRVDSFAAANVRGARAANVNVGLYFYAHPSNSPLQEARWFLRNADPYLHDGDLPPALDLEVAEGHDWPYLNEWKATWFAAVDPAVGCRATFYSNRYFLGHMTLFPDRPIWGAAPDPAFTPPDRWSFHQYSFTGSCLGIGGHVDLDRVLKLSPPIKGV